jgi:hypothetical protein
VCWRLGGTKGAQYEQRIIIFFYGKRNANYHLGTGILYTTHYYQQKRVVFVSDRVSYIVLRGRWCNIIVQNVHGTSEEKSDES